MGSQYFRKGDSLPFLGHWNFPWLESSTVHMEVWDVKGHQTCQHVSTSDPNFYIHWGSMLFPARFTYAEKHLDLVWCWNQTIVFFIGSWCKACTRNCTLHRFVYFSEGTFSPSLLNSSRIYTAQECNHSKDMKNWELNIASWIPPEKFAAGYWHFTWLSQGKGATSWGLSAWVQNGTESVSVFNILLVHKCTN